MKKKIAIIIAAILVIVLLFAVYNLKNNKNDEVSNDIYEVNQEAINEDEIEIDKYS